MQQRLHGFSPAFQIQGPSELQIASVFFFGPSLLWLLPIPPVCSVQQNKGLLCIPHQPPWKRPLAPSANTDNLCPRSRKPIFDTCALPSRLASICYLDSKWVLGSNLLLLDRELLVHKTHRNDRPSPLVPATHSPTNRPLQKNITSDNLPRSFTRPTCAALSISQPVSHFLLVFGVRVPVDGLFVPHFLDQDQVSRLALLQVQSSVCTRRTPMPSFDPVGTSWYLALTTAAPLSGSSAGNLHLTILAASSALIRIRSVGHVLAAGKRLTGGGCFLCGRTWSGTLSLIIVGKSVGGAFLAGASTFLCPVEPRIMFALTSFHLSFCSSNGLLVVEHTFVQSS